MSMQYMLGDESEKPFAVLVWWSDREIFLSVINEFDDAFQFFSKSVWSENIDDSQKT